MPITLLRDTSASAPVLSGTSGAFINVLDFCLVTTMGWVKEYSGSNLAAYRASSSIGGNRFYLRVDDTSAQSPRIRAYESMTAISTGAGLFPTDAQVNGGLFAYKSSTADSTARPWIFISNGRMFYLFWAFSGTPESWGTSSGKGLYFGDFKSFKSGDAFNTILVSDNTATQTYANWPSDQINTTSIAATTPGHYVARSHTQIGTSLNAGKFTDIARTAQAAAVGSGGMTYPAPIVGGLIQAPLWITEGTIAGDRGQFPGIWCPCHARPIAHGDTFTGVTGLSGRSFEAINLNVSSQIFIETSDTWDV